MRIRPSWKVRAALLVCASLAMPRLDPAFASSEKTIALPEDRLLEEVRFDASGGRFVMAIPIDSPWSHWTLGNPPRIIVDLGGTRSRLPNAPGLYEKSLAQGVVKSFRTSQHVNSPLDRRVRLTLELSRIVPYEARRVGNEIQIVIPEGEFSSKWSSSVRGEGSAAAEATLPASHTTTPASQTTPPASQEHAETVKASHASTPSPLLPPEDELASAEQAADVAHDVVRQLEANGMAAAGSASSLPNTKHAPANDPIQPAPTAAGTKVEHAVPAHEVSEHTTEPLDRAAHAADPAEQAAANPRKPAQAKPSPATHSKDVKSLRAALEDAVGKDNVRDLNHEHEAPVSTGAEHEVDPSEHAEAAPTEAVGTHSSHETLAPAAHASDESESEPASSADEDLQQEEDPPPVPVSEMHERNAEKSYAEALKRYLHGEPTAAIKYCRRARKYYPECEATGHASLLLRELWILNGNDVEADQLTGVSAAPDSAWMPIEVLTRLLDGHKQQKNWLELERLLREWGPHYVLDERLTDLHWALAQAFLEQKKRDPARDHLLEIPDAHPLGPRALLLLAQMSEDEGARADAAELYRRLSYLASSVWQQRGLARTADLSFQAGEIAGSLESYEALLESRPPPDEEVWAVFQVANCLLLLGDLAGAKLRYETVSTRWPKSYWAPFAQERLEAMAWNRDLSKRIEATAKP